MVRILNHSHILEYTYLFSILRVFSFFGNFVLKVAHCWFNLHETWHTTLFVIYYYVEVVRIEIHSHILELTCYLRVFKLFWH